MGRRWTARRSGEIGTKTNHAACQDEKDGDLETDRSGGNRRLGGVRSEQIEGTNGLLLALALQLQQQKSGRNIVLGYH